VDGRRLDGLSQDHHRQDGGEPPRQHRLPRPGGAEGEDVMGRTPAIPSVSPYPRITSALAPLALAGVRIARSLLSGSAACKGVTIWSLPKSCGASFVLAIYSTSPDVGSTGVPALCLR
jgi:hypothetical protein